MVIIGWSIKKYSNLNDTFIKLFFCLEFVKLLLSLRFLLWEGLGLLLLKKGVSLLFSILESGVAGRIGLGKSLNIS